MLPSCHHQSFYRRILAAHEFSAGRHNGSNSQVNARLSADQIDRHIVLAPDIKRFLEEAKLSNAITFLKHFLITVCF